MIEKILSKKSYTITGAAIVIGTASFVSKIIALARDRIFAHYFGAGDVMDAYYAAFKIPDLVFNLLIVGALSAGFIPIFLELLNKDKKEAWKVTNTMINILGILLIVSCTILIFFTPQFLKLLVPGFSGDKFQLTVMLSRIMFVSPILLGISSIVSGVLQSFKAFLIYSLSPIMYNLGIIIGALFLVPIFGNQGLAMGVVLGALFHLLIQIPAFIQHGFKYQAIFDWKNKNVRKIFKLMLPRTLGMATLQINFLAITIIASTLSSGSLSIFNFADNIQSVPTSIIGISFAIAIFPALSQMATNKENKKMIKHISETIKQIFFLIIPLTIILIMLRAQIVRVILGTGEFDWDATRLTFNALGIFAISLFAQSLIPILSRSFYALQDTMTPLIISIISTIINIILAVYLSTNYGILGLIFAYSITMIFQFGLLWLLLRNKLGTLQEKKIFISVLKISIAAIIMAIFIQTFKVLLSSIVDMDRFWGVLLQVSISATIGLLIYGFICHQLKLREMHLFHESFKKRWLKLRNVDTGINNNI
ncbi:MAG: murein biosynthesis integral membrane protein MurJ [Candidatus Magasanikbacteria bacterium CG_4_10_14_0_8_um_filter_32_14]|uniref:Probable lipid II flippase MurJ n=1 Tax=Candidatus Magasanikbacteria bacterium CG_4_10_14_0_8_um_filter_32_14 TaxID=1974640 RepID=A0A2M7R9U1_9BACT|nr:MAG: murein biosynthesis integral membrane protein MurJ [Candidatus Magasanikbacteria bacterium CG_4_10_14_0_8_um_filter_32_14]